ALRATCGRGARSWATRPPVGPRPPGRRSRRRRPGPRAATSTWTACPTGWRRRCGRRSRPGPPTAPAPPTCWRSCAPRAPARRALPDEARAPTAAGAAPRAGARRALRWLGGPAVVGAAAAVAAVVPLLAAIILAVVLVLVAVALRLARSTAPAGARPLLPAWS